MNIKHISVPIISISAILLCASCTQRQERSRNADKYDSWKESLADSIETVSKARQLTEDSLTNAYSQVDSMLRNFTYVENPREVEGYTILSSARSSYPLSRTGLSARLSKSGDFEIIAVHSGSPFTSISLSDGISSVSTSEIPADQGLNYRTGSLTTMLISGDDAAAVGEFILKAGDKPVSVSYGKTRSRLNTTDASTVASTWKLASLRKEITRMERNLQLLSKKADALRRAAM